MKKYLLIVVVLGLAIGAIYAQATPTQTTPRPANQPVTGFQGVRQYVEQEELLIEIKSMIPATDVFQDKTDTYQHAGKYDFNFDLETIKTNSEILLNKWLKESK